MHTIEKRAEFKTDFLNEGKIQQDIYVKTISPNGLPCCLSVADVSVIETKDASGKVDKHATQRDCVELLELLKKGAPAQLVKDVLSGLQSLMTEKGKYF